MIKVNVTMTKPVKPAIESVTVTLDVESAYALMELLGAFGDELTLAFPRHAELFSRLSHELGRGVHPLHALRLCAHDTRIITRNHIKAAITARTEIENRL